MRRQLIGDDATPVAGLPATWDSPIALDLDIQRASGAFPIDFLDGFTNVYADVGNVVVRLRHANECAFGRAC